MDPVKEEMIKQDERGEPMNIVKAAEDVALRLENSTKRAEAILQSAEKLRAEQILAGTSGAIVQPTPVKEETPKEYAERMMGYKIGFKK